MNPAIVFCILVNTTALLYRVEVTACCTKDVVASSDSSNISLTFVQLTKYFISIINQKFLFTAPIFTLT